MPRQSRIIVPNVAHHVTQRGNYGIAVFLDEGDYLTYCSHINHYSRKYNVKILAYCLMTNHVHFIVIPPHEESLARMFNTAHMRYSQHMNKKNKERGHLWQGRFFSCIMDEDHIMRGVRYIERNPVRAKMVRHAGKYRWSSAGAHMGKREADINLYKGLTVVGEEEWSDYVRSSDDEMYNEMKIKTQKGLVIGSESFRVKMEKILGRTLVVRDKGRPRKDS
ncbi:transposase [Candidatus Omnitrophota bacterium]